MEATEPHSEGLPRLSPRQRATLLAYARAGTIERTADLLELAPQTVKNHLSEAYHLLGVRTGPQAIYVLMGGDDVLRNLPGSLPSRRQLRARGVALQMPDMVDGELWLRDLRSAARMGDAEVGAAEVCDTCRLSSARATLSELVSWLTLYVRPGRAAGVGTQ